MVDQHKQVLSAWLIDEGDLLRGFRRTGCDCHGIGLKASRVSTCGQCSIQVDIPLRHYLGGKTIDENVTYSLSIKFKYLTGSDHSLLFAIDYEAGDAMFNHFGDGTTIPGDNRCTASHCLYHD
ncbi:hypothetical protein D3C73_1256880 [compost metagenome]